MEVVKLFFFELQAFKAKIKDVLRRSYCYYGDLLFKRDDCILFTNDLAFV